MLTRHTFTHPQQRADIFKTYNPHTTTWIVSDLKSKLTLQKKCLETANFIPENAVLRASELWRKLFFRGYPQIAHISQDLSVHLISEWLEKSEAPWSKTSGAGLKMFEFMTHFASVLSHPACHDRMGDWFRIHIESYMRWGEWFVEAEKLWNEFRSRNLLPQAWISSLLASGNAEILVEKGFWSQNLVIDLGPDLNSLEAEIVLQLSRRLDVTILSPQLSSKQYERLLQPYRTFDFVQESSTKTLSIPQPNIEVRRFATMLSEVKDVTGQVREWIEKGIAPDKIAIVAPNIKYYWRCLDQYFLQEGIPLRGERGTILSDLPDIGVWMSELKLRTIEVNSEDLEQALFSQQENVTVKFDRFKTLYSRIYGNEDLERSPEIAQLVLSRPFMTKKNMTKREFIVASLSLWPEAGHMEHLEKVVSLIYRDGPDHVVLPSRGWVSYLTSLLQRSDLIAEKIDVGVHCVGLDSAEDLDVEAVFFLGLSDSELRAYQMQRLDLGETQSIQALTGFLFPNTDNSRLDFKARWFIGGQKQAVLSFPTTDFNGDTLSPSLLWLEEALKTRSKDELEVIDSPRLSRWDALQQLELEEIAKSRNLNQPQTQHWTSRIRADLGEITEPGFAQNQTDHLSPSSIEDYLKCPFIFASKRLYKLLDQPDLDLDVDNSTRGRLIHKLFEKLLSQEFRYDYNESEIGQFLEDGRLEIKAEFGDERTWKFLKAKLVELGLRFLNFEKSWRARFPQTRTVLCEADVQGFINKNNLNFEREGSSETIGFKGFIDRIDTDHKGHAVILDYKSSGTELRQYNSWLENNKLQLGLYAMAVEKGLTSLGLQDVVGASYYVSRTMDRNYGFKQIEGGDALVDLEKVGKNKISIEEKNEFYELLKLKIKTVLEGIEKGEFQPNPFEPEKCPRCQWNQICRAPHLN